MPHCPALSTRIRALTEGTGDAVTATRGCELHPSDARGDLTGLHRMVALERRKIAPSHDRPRRPVIPVPRGAAAPVRGMWFGQDIETFHDHAALSSCGMSIYVRSVLDGRGGRSGVLDLVDARPHAFPAADPRGPAAISAATVGRR